MRALAVTALVWGFTAMAQAVPTTKVMTTVPVTGAALDTVVASVLDVGVSRGGTLTVTLRILSDSGAVLAEVTGPVTEGVPLRLSARAPSAAGVRAQLVFPSNTEPLALGGLVFERWTPPAPPGNRPLFCKIPRTGDPLGGYPNPTTGEPLRCTVAYGN
ncbi:hypothetical protein D7Y13_06515 [Corallococcus praedator]|uniref:Uncharacterized protein n=1 Tax=Corallococcus praedator TaxID=2316724 RepID=A0ABX9QMX9_9BACT|nr:hypothetical protein D7X74_25290 [Corallococcus sp. CA047B]RKH32732.1 hypothetical protein D7X75_14740 [Corallococcus sp. CA031C]RKI14170.1 hypothetical protein D7Y13_06515 [Corallococcus praedator]